MRKALIRSTGWPYHVCSRSNNSEWFYVPIEDVWRIACRRLSETAERYEVWIHAFVLMSNHFHLLMSAPNGNLDQAVRYLKTEMARDIQLISGRTNHIFGGRYKWSLLATQEAVAYVYKYILRNPVRAGMCRYVEDYKYSTLAKSRIPLVELTGVAWKRIRALGERRLSWLNRPAEKELEEMISKAMRRKEFRFSRGRDVQFRLTRLERDYIESV